jgi:tripartite-type tricarboxylate transporter receptor subunit TctC
VQPARVAPRIRYVDTEGPQTADVFAGFIARRRCRARDEPLSSAQNQEGKDPMTISRRSLLTTAGGLLGAAALPRFASAETYPSRPVRIVVGFSPGGAPDIMARLFAQWLTEKLGQRFIVENKGGAGGNLGTELVAKAQPDGYTLLLVAPNDAVNASLYEKLNYNFLRDLEPVVALARTPQVLEVNPSVPANTVPELIAYMKANPGKLTLASPGVGTGPHMAAELFRTMAGVDFVHVPYRGAGAALGDTVGGQVQMIFTTVPSSREFVRAGKLRALGVSTNAPSAQLPDVPPLSQSVPGFEASFWMGLAAPKNTPPEVIATLNKAVNDTLADPAVKTRLADMDMVLSGGTPAEFKDFIAAETQKWAKVVKANGLKPE